MALIRFSGTVTAVRNDDSRFFRINNRPVVAYMAMNLAQGDEVTVVAREAAEPIIEALRNESTNVTYAPSESEPHLDKGGIIAGILLIPAVGIGFFILWATWRKYRLEAG